MRQARTAKGQTVQGMLRFVSARLAICRSCHHKGWFCRGTDLHQVRKLQTRKVRDRSWEGQSLKSLFHTNCPKCFAGIADTGGTPCSRKGLRSRVCNVRDATKQEEHLRQVSHLTPKQLLRNILSELQPCQKWCGFCLSSAQIDVKELCVGFCWLTVLKPDDAEQLRNQAYRRRNPTHEERRTQETWPHRRTDR